jgi:hypothetical protein
VIGYLVIFVFAVLEGEIYYSKVCADAIAGRLPGSQSSWRARSEVRRAIRSGSIFSAGDPLARPFSEAAQVP